MTNPWASTAAMLGGVSAYAIGAAAAMENRREPTLAETKSELEQLQRSHEALSRALLNSSVALSRAMDDAAELQDELRKERLITDQLRQQLSELIELDKRVAKLETVLKQNETTIAELRKIADLHKSQEAVVPVDGSGA